MVFMHEDVQKGILWERDERDMKAGMAGRAE